MICEIAKSTHVFQKLATPLWLVFLSNPACVTAFHFLCCRLHNFAFASMFGLLLFSFCAISEALHKELWSGIDSLAPMLSLQTRILQQFHFHRPPAFHFSGTEMSRLRQKFPRMLLRRILMSEENTTESAPPQSQEVFAVPKNGEL